MKLYCLECGWAWWFPPELADDAECDNCGGELTEDEPHKGTSANEDLVEVEQ